MVVRANKESSELGGHIATYQSAATLYEVGFNHFWHAPSEQHGGDLVYFQGHSSPGNYARAYLEGRLTEAQLDGFRQEVSRDGLASYPHPWLMPEFWQFPTVSLGIGPITSIYQARFMKYLQARNIVKTDGRKVWVFAGDGEMDEPESMGAIGLAGREQLDNLIWVVNCNLQRLDGPVRGNGKIIQELESSFRGAGWNVIKVIWGSRWDPLLADGHRRPAGQGDGGVCRRRVPDVQVARRRLCARALLRPRSGAARTRLAHVRPGHLAAQPRRPRPAEGLRRVRRRCQPHRSADRDPGQDDQGLRDGRLGRGPDDHPPGQEDDRGGTAGSSATASICR